MKLCDVHLIWWHAASSTCGAVRLLNIPHINLVKGEKLTYLQFNRKTKEPIFYYPYIYWYHHDRQHCPVSTMWLCQWRRGLTAEVSRVQWGDDHIWILRNCTVIGVNDDWTSASINTFICTCIGTLFRMNVLMTYAMHEHSKEYFKTSCCYVHQNTMFHVCTLTPSCDHASNYSLNSDTRFSSRPHSRGLSSLIWQSISY